MLKVILLLVKDYEPTIKNNFLKKISLKKNVTNINFLCRRIWLITIRKDEYLTRFFSLIFIESKGVDWYFLDLI